MPGPVCRATPGFRLFPPAVRSCEPGPGTSRPGRLRGRLGRTTGVSEWPRLGRLESMGRSANDSRRFRGSQGLSTRCSGAIRASTATSCDCGGLGGNPVPLCGSLVAAGGRAVDGAPRCCGRRSRRCPGGRSAGSRAAAGILRQSNDRSKPTGGMDGAPGRRPSIWPACACGARAGRPDPWLVLGRRWRSRPRALSPLPADKRRGRRGRGRCRRNRAFGNRD